MVMALSLHETGAVVFALLLAVVSTVGAVVLINALLFLWRKR